jgi:hypothetical protein
MIEDISCINKTNKIDETLKCESDYIEEVIEEELEDLPVNTYDKFLEDTHCPNKIEKEYLHSILRNQMKNIVTNIKERQKDQENIKSEKKKSILLNLQNTNNQVLDDDMIKDILINKINLQSSKEIKSKPEVLTFGNLKMNEQRKISQNQNEEYGDFVNEDIKSNNEAALDDDDVTQINQTVNEEEKTELTCNDNTCNNDKTRLIESKQFDMNEFIKENTRDEILVDPEEELQYAEIQQIKSINKKRFTIGNDYE